ncbi:MAG: hypothetical protein JXR39_05820 [Marinilabiliaceae bacterium]|nr:hypothetical protein [Marinilabiliaceae bacterium]
MKQIIITTWLIVTTANIVTGQPMVQHNAVSLGLAECDATLSNAFSIFGSPAGLAEVPRSNVAAMGTRRFNIKELTMGSLAANWRTQHGTVSVGLSQTGFATWQSSLYAASFARRFGRVSAGFQINYWHEYQAQVGSFSNITSQAAIIYHPSNDLSIGVNLINPEQSTIDYGIYTMPLPSVMTIGAAWKPVKGSKIFLEADQPVEGDMQIATAIEGQIHAKLALRGGYSLTRDQMSAGLGIMLKPLKVDLGLQNNMTLGWITSFAITYDI